MPVELRQTMTITSRWAWIALVALLGHLLLMATPLHEPSRHGAAMVGGVHRTAGAWERDDVPAAQADAEQSPDCALEPAPATSSRPAPAPGPTTAPPLATAAGHAGYPAGVASRHPPWPGDTQALLQVFRLLWPPGRAMPDQPTA